MAEKQTHASGIGVDASGGPVVDPTANVMSLVEASGRRLDELREAETRRINELRDAESRRVDEQMSLRSEYAERLAVAEAKRIDAIRAVDVNAVAVASERASAQATVLANQVAQSAEALRSLVATTASAAQQNRQQDMEATARSAAAQHQGVQQSMTAISSRLTTLEQERAKGEGKQLVTDPQLDKVAQVVERLATAQSTNTGKTAGINWTVVAIAGVAGFVLTLIGIAGAVAALYAAMKH